MNNWKNAVTVAPIGLVNLDDVRNDTPANEAEALALLDAAARFDARTDAFAAGKGAICRDIAKRVNVNGFASEKQREYAAKLVAWSKPRAALPQVTLPGSTAPLVTADADVVLAQTQLKAAAKRYEAAGKTRTAATCRDIAEKLERFGSFASEAQKAFGLRLVYEAPEAAPAPAEFKTALSPALAVPKLFEVMQKHATLRAGDLKISRKNQDTLCWLVWRGRPVGKIDNALAIVWNSLSDTATRTAILVLLAEFDADPLGAAVKYGKLSGTCCSCGRDLTDPASIEAGIGPICAQKF